MSDFIAQVSDQLNLRWAWEKVRREASPGDVWIDEIEFAGFELELEQNLQGIAKEFRKGWYRLAPLKPMPFPKNPDKDGKPRIRQMFHVAIRDQVAWTAMVNILGPHVDSKMPAWSYGHRLYRSIWVEENPDGTKRRKIGNYRHASGRIYLPFQQSWPVFRRHVYLATRAMTSVANPAEMDERTQEELELQDNLAAEHRCPFISRQYWEARQTTANSDELYWCSIDLEKFYPTMKLSVIHDNILSQLPPDWHKEASRLLRSMFRFSLDLSGWNDDELTRIDLRLRRRHYHHLPTGLYVSGFLANAGLLQVDAKVVEQLRTKDIAHFRFVDDHIILAYRFDDLVSWIKEYEALLKQANTGATINFEKVEPKELVNSLQDRMSVEMNESAKKKCRLDPQFPSPLMTKTLALVSDIARTDFNLLEQSELLALANQLEHLLLVELPDEEIPEKTRLSFAATRLTRLVECRLANNETLTALKVQMDRLDAEHSKLESGDAQKQGMLLNLNESKKNVEREEKRQTREVSRIFHLVRKVLRERPDRTRLWARAVLMCRLTGVHGLKDLLKDIASLREEGGANLLASEYLQANLLALVGEQSLLAARILRDPDSADWRKHAARTFLEEAVSTKLAGMITENSRWFLRTSWQQCCFGIYCADLTMKDATKLGSPSEDVYFDENILKIGRQCVIDGNGGHSPVRWAWWAARMTLRDLAPRASGLVRAIGSSLPASPEACAYWQFFPMDVPAAILDMMCVSDRYLSGTATIAGWWYDALRERPEAVICQETKQRRNVLSRVTFLLNQEQKATVSLYEWCEFLINLQAESPADLRRGEWTALEIVRQIALLLSEELNFDYAYLRKARKSIELLPWVHPANFRIPKDWLDPHDFTWCSLPGYYIS